MIHYGEGRKITIPCYPPPWLTPVRFRNNAPAFIVGISVVTLAHVPEHVSERQPLVLLFRLPDFAQYCVVQGCLAVPVDP